MSKDKDNPAVGFISKATVPDMDLEGVSREEINELSEQIKAVIGDSPCNFLLVMQGQDASLCVTDGKIASTRAMSVMQVICAGVFSEMIGDEERHVLSAVADSIEERFNQPAKAKDESKIILLN